MDGTRAYAYPATGLRWAPTRRHARRVAPRWRAVWLATVVLVAACSSLTAVSLLIGARTAGSPPDAGVSRHAWAPGLADAARAAGVPTAYVVELLTAGHWRATNPAHGIEATFSSEAVAVRTSGAAGPGWHLSMSASALGRTGGLASVDPPLIAAEGGRIEYRRGALTEWYVNDPRGIQQGFTVAEPPLPGTEGAVVVEVDIATNLVPRVADDARGLLLSDGSEAVVASYEGLVAFDANGRDLPARLELQGTDLLRLIVEDAGAAYPLTIDPFVATQQAKLIAADAAPSDFFALDVSIWGNTAVVGSPFSGGGAAYVFVRSGTTWSQQAKLVGADVAADDQFGRAVAIWGDTIVVGSLGDDNEGGDGAGSAYVFVRSGTTWGQQAKVRADDGEPFAFLGGTVAIYGDTIVAGAGRDDHPEAGANAGSAYVFVRSGTSWSQQAKLTASDPAADNEFGTSVAIWADTAVIGAEAPLALQGPQTGDTAGSAYVFVRSGSSWSQQAKLTADVPTLGDQFGFSVAVENDTALVGSHFDDDNGSVFVFVRSGGTWSQQAKLTSSEPEMFADFGASVDLHGNVAVVGAPFEDGVGSRSGAAYFFERSGTTWTQQDRVAPADLGDPANFGGAVALWGDTAVIGASRHAAAGADSGAAYVFVLRPRTATTVSSSDGTSVSGQAVTFTATVAPLHPQTGTPTGTVQFAAGGVNVGSPVPLVAGVAHSPPVNWLGVGSHTVTAMYSGDGVFAGSSGTLVQVVERPPCTQTLSGEVSGPVIVEAGASACVATGAQVAGAVTVRPGGSLTVANAQLRGGVWADGPNFLEICGSEIAVRGQGLALRVAGAPVPITLGQPSAGCAGNRVAGSIEIVSNHGAALRENVARQVTINGNGFGATVLAGNRVFGALACSSNNPTPTNGGQPNVAASKTGQCVGL